MKSGAASPVELWLHETKCGMAINIELVVRAIPAAVMRRYVRLQANLRPGHSGLYKI